MNAYLDSSVVLRVVLGQPGRWRDWRSVRLGIGSGLVEVECLRTLDRLRLEGALSNDELTLRRETVYRARHGAGGAYHSGAAPSRTAYARAVRDAGRDSSGHGPVVA